MAAVGSGSRDLGEVSLLDREGVCWESECLPAILAIDEWPMATAGRSLLAVYGVRTHAGQTLAKRGTHFLNRLLRITAPVAAHHPTTSAKDDKVDHNGHDHQ